MSELIHLKTKGMKSIGGCLLWDGILYRGDDLLKCFIGAMERRGTSFEERYGFDPFVELIAACDLLDAMIFKPGNSLIGIDLLESDGKKYFAIYFKEDALCELYKLRGYAEQNGYRFACHIGSFADEIIVADRSSIVLEVVNV